MPDKSTAPSYPNQEQLDLARQQGVDTGKCVICAAFMFIETPYQSMGLCSDCVCKAAFQYQIKHGGNADRMFWPEGYKPPVPQLSGAKKQKITNQLRTKVFERDAYRCKHCGTHKDLRCDHIFPESKGGETTLKNLQTLCQSCNSKKGTKIV